MASGLCGAAYGAGSAGCPCRTVRVSLRRIKHNEDGSYSITRNGKDVLLMPERYSPNASFNLSCGIGRRAVVIGCPSGLVLIFRFSE